jgi:hypothetical protein
MKKIEGIFNIAKELGLAENYTRLSGLLQIIDAPKRITEGGVGKYSITEYQLKVIRNYTEAMRKEMKK